MKLIFALSLVFGASTIANAAVEPMKFKTLNELRSRVEYYVTCSGASSGLQVHVMFHVNPMLIGVPITMQHAGIAIISPNEGLMIHEWDTRGLDVNGNTPGLLTFSGITSSTHNDYISVVIKDATNGRFRGKLEFRDRATGVAVSADVTCAGTNYPVPKL